jgi:hypothetical protein
MINLLKSKDFDYTGSNFTEKKILEKGHICLSGEELLSRISNMRVFGDYPAGYKFVTEIYKTGTVKGVNNIGTFDSGIWSIDYEKHTLQLKWENAWIDTITRAYDINGNIEFFDIDTGKWRTTFKIFERVK